MDISAVSLLFDIAAKIKSAIDKADSAQVRALLAEFQEMVTDAKLEVINIKEQNIKLLEEIQELKLKAQNKESLLQKPNGLYYYKDVPDRNICSKCYESEGKQITVQQKEYSLGAGNYLTGESNFCDVQYFCCPECKTEYEI